MTARLFEEGSEPCSLTYLGFSMSAERPYIGIVEERPPIERFQERFQQADVIKQN